MSDQPSGLPAAGSGQTQNASPATPAAPATPATPAGQGEQQQGAAASAFTRADALALFEEMFSKKGQSIADRTAARVQKIMDAARQKGAPMTETQARAVLDVVDAAQLEQQPGQTATPPATAAQPQQAKPAEQTQDPTTAAEKIVRSFGLNPDEVSPQDPEYKLLDLVTDDPKKYMNSVEAYAKAKAKRLEEQGDTARLPGLASRGGTTTTPSHAGLSGTETLDSYFRTKFGG